MKQSDFAACLEAFYWQSGRLPSLPEFNREYNVNLTAERFDSALSNPSLKKHLAVIGVPLEGETFLTGKQMEFLRVLFDPTNTKPLAFKLKECKVTGTEYSAWLRDPAFARVLRNEADKRFENSEHRVLQALEREASGGNVAAMKLYFEMTGRYTPSAKGAVNVTINQDARELASKMLEVLQRRLPAELLMQVADDLEAVLFPRSATPARAHLSVIPVREILPVESEASVEDGDNGF